MAIVALAVMSAVSAVEPLVTVPLPDRVVAHGVTPVMLRMQVVEHLVSNVEHFDRGQPAELTLEGVPEIVAGLRWHGREQPRTRQHRQCADRSARKVESLRIHDVSSPGWCMPIAEPSSRTARRPPDIIRRIRGLIIHGVISPRI